MKTNKALLEEIKLLRKAVEELSKKQGCTHICSHPIPYYPYQPIYPYIPYQPKYFHWYGTGTGAGAAGNSNNPGIGGASNGL